jgi:nucleotidyltransferase AbiEii toxin of type IV toxin-antitoxin system
MPLYRELDGFEDLLAATADQLNLQAGVIEKDYWVTQALRGMQNAYPGEFIFKGGTSLSKAWNLIERFSEDIDILLSGEGLSGSARERLLKRVCEAAAEAIGATAEKLGGGDSYRHVELSLGDERPLGPPAHPSIRLDVGYSGGTEPHQPRTIRTLVGALLEQRDEAAQDDYDDLQPFELDVLLPSRTLVEKLILVNSAARDCAKDLDQLQERRVGRHFYDIHSVLDDAGVRDDLADREQFNKMVTDAIRITKDEFGMDYERPEGGFANGHAFTCEGGLREALEAEYTTVMDVFYFGQPPYPTFTETLELARTHAELL